MKILFIIGCPRSGTSFCFYLFENVSGFYFNKEVNYEPEELSSLIRNYVSKDIEYDYFQNEFISFFEKQNINDKFIIVKLPQFSFVINEIINMFKGTSHDIKIIITKRNIADIENSMLHHDGSLLCCNHPFKSVTLPEKYRNLWEQAVNAHEKTIIRIYAYLNAIDSSNKENVKFLNYGDNIHNNKELINYFGKTKGMVDIIYEELKRNYKDKWKNKRYYNSRLERGMS